MSERLQSRPRGGAIAAGVALLLSGCASLIPPYERPAAPIAAT
jgi:hypothetical protein